MKKRVLFISPLPPPHYGSAMSSKMCLDIIDESEAFEVRNIKLNYSKKVDDVGKINTSKITGIFQVKKQIKIIIKEFKPDVIYFVPATCGLGLIRDWLFVKEIKKHWKGKIMFHIRSRILDKTWNSFHGKRILKSIYSGGIAIVLGKELIGDLRGIVPKKHISILPNAIKNEVSNYSLNKIIKKRKEKKEINILFLSNMDRNKGWPELLDACKILEDKKFNFRCDFVGDWFSKKDKEYFQNFVKENKLERKVFAHGRKVGKEKNKFLERSNVLVFPTKYPMETFGRVILEGYMYSVPVIANGIATIPTTILEGKTGLVLKKNTGREIAEKIINGENWSKMGLAGRKRFVSNFEMEDYKKKFLKLFFL